MVSMNLSAIQILMCPNPRKKIAPGVDFITVLGAKDDCVKNKKRGAAVSTFSVHMFML